MSSAWSALFSGICLFKDSEHLRLCHTTWNKKASQFLGLGTCARHALSLYQGKILGSNWISLSPCFSLEAIQVNRLDVSLNTLQQVPDWDGLRAKRECQDWKACQGIISRDLGKTLEDLSTTKYLNRFHQFNFSSFLGLFYCKPSCHFYIKLPLYLHVILGRCGQGSWEDRFFKELEELNMSWAFFIGAYSLLWILNITYLSANAWGFTVIVDTAFIALYWFEYFVQNKMIIFFFLPRNVSYTELYGCLFENLSFIQKLVQVSSFLLYVRIFNNTRKI